MKNEKVEVKETNDVVASDITAKIKKVIGLQKKLMTALKNSVPQAIEIGGLLTDIKAGLAHGKWLGWLKKNIIFSQQTVTNYMHLYAHQDDPKLLNVRDLSKAYEVLRETARSKKNQATVAKNTAKTTEKGAKSNVSTPTGKTTSLVAKKAEKLENKLNTPDAIYVSILTQIVSKLPSIPPPDWADDTFADAKRLATIILERLETIDSDDAALLEAEPVDERELVGAGA